MEHIPTAAATSIRSWRSPSFLPDDIPSKGKECRIQRRSGCDNDYYKRIVGGAINNSGKCTIDACHKKSGQQAKVHGRMVR